MLATRADGSPSLPDADTGAAGALDGVIGITGGGAGSGGGAAGGPAAGDAAKPPKNG